MDRGKILALPVSTLVDAVIAALSVKQTPQSIELFGQLIAAMPEFEAVKNNSDVKENPANFLADHLERRKADLTPKDTVGAVLRSLFAGETAHVQSNVPAPSRTLVTVTQGGGAIVSARTIMGLCALLVFAIYDLKL